MDDPLTEISGVIYEVAGAATPDAQLAAIERYFAPDAGFRYPVFEIARGAGSRARIAGAYLFYRNAVRTVRYEFLAVAFDAAAGRVFVELNQWPNFVGLRAVIGDWRCCLHMFAVLSVEKVKQGPLEGKWIITRQEDCISPPSVFSAFPHLAPLGALFFSFAGFLGLINACILMFLGLWTPTNPLQTATRLLSNA